MTAPCKDCPDRVLGCHSSCDKYKAFREERDRELEQRKLQAMGRTLDSKWFQKRCKIKQRLARRRNPRG